MIQLRRCRNDSIAVPINRLPPELLRMVLSYLRLPPSDPFSEELSTSESRFPSYGPLVSAMLVCHKWHAIGSQAASLWTDIDFVQYGAVAATVLLTRSLGAPIRIYGCLDGDDALSTFVTDNSARICDLDLLVAADLSHPIPILQSTLAVDMPRARILSLAPTECLTNAVVVVAHSATPARFAALQAVLLKSFLFIPAHPLPQLTHLRLSALREIDSSNILDLLQTTPALEVLHVSTSGQYIVPQNWATRSWASVLLPRLYSVSFLRCPSTIIHELMTHIETPSLAVVSLSSVFPKTGTLASRHLVPNSLAARIVTRVAIEVQRKFYFMDAAFHGPDLSVSIGIKSAHTGDPMEAKGWAHDDLPTLLPFHAVEELHFQADNTISSGLLPTIAARMPAVSTLVIKYSEWPSDCRTSESDSAVSVVHAVAAILSQSRDLHGLRSGDTKLGPDSTMLLPRLEHLEFIVHGILQGLCELLVPALAQRAQDGRRLKTLRIRWTKISRNNSRSNGKDPAELSYVDARIFEYVDSFRIDEMKDSEEDGEEEGSTGRLGWGRWKNCVQPPEHGYW